MCWKIDWQTQKVCCYLTCTPQDIDDLFNFWILLSVPYCQGLCSGIAKSDGASERAWWYELPATQLCLVPATCCWTSNQIESTYFACSAGDCPKATTGRPGAFQLHNKEQGLTKDQIHKPAEVKREQTLRNFSAFEEQCPKFWEVPGKRCFCSFLFRGGSSVDDCPYRNLTAHGTGAATSGAGKATDTWKEAAVLPRGSCINKGKGSKMF